MKKHLYVVLLFYSAIFSAQSDNLNKVSFQFYPAFETASILEINHKTAKAIFQISQSKKKYKFKLSDSENSIVESAVNNLLYKSRPPIDTLEFKQGEVKRLVVIDGRLAEDGMSTIVYYGKADKKRFGNLYSKSEAKNLLIILNIVKNRHPNIGYIEILEEYLY